MIADPAAPLSAVVLDHRVREKGAFADDMDFAKYAETRDPELIREKQAGSLTKYMLMPLDVMFVGTLDGVENIATRRILAFQASCRGVAGGVDAIDLKPSALTPGRFGSLLAPDEFVRDVAAKRGMLAVYEMGDLALQRARLPAGAAGPFVWSGI